MNKKYKIRQAMAFLLALVFTVTPIAPVFSNSYFEDYHTEDYYSEDFHIRTPRMGITVTFDANGGTTPEGNATRTTTTGNASSGTIGAAMPLVPIAPGGFGFVHWNTAQDGTGQVFTGQTTVTAPTTVFAQWGHEIRFMGGGINLPEGNDQSNPAHFMARIVLVGTNVNDAEHAVWPNDPTRAGHTFLGWFDAQGNEFTQHSPIDNNVVVFAHWEEVIVVIPTHTVTFDPSGGQIATGHQNTRLVRSGIGIRASALNPYNFNMGFLWQGSAPNATRAGMTVEGWWTQPNGVGTRFAGPGTHTAPTFANVAASEWPQSFATTPVNSDLTVYANWVYRVSFNPNGAAWIPHPHRDIPITVVNGTVNANSNVLHSLPNNTPEHAAQGMPPAPPRPGFNFLGWFTESAGGTEFTGDTPVNASITVFAHWELIEVEPPSEVTLTFCTNGGLFEDGTNTTERVLLSGQNLWQAFGSSPPAAMPFFPVRDGYVFMGWYPQGQYPANGVNNGRLHRELPITQDVTYYARWLPYNTITMRTNMNGTWHEVDRRVPTGFSFMHMNAVWRPEHGVRPESQPTLQPPDMGGTFYYAVGSNSVNIPAGRPIGLGYVFVGWVNGPNSREASVFNNTHTITGDMTIYSVWRAHVQFVANNGTGINVNPEIRSIVIGETIESNFTHPSRNQGFTANNTYPAMEIIAFRHYLGHWQQLSELMHNQRAFLGFNTSANGTGEWFTPYTQVEMRTMVFAIWAEGVTFHSGIAPIGTIAEENMHRMVAQGQSLGENMPPEPVWEGRNFLAWGSQPVGGIVYNEDTPIAEIGRALFARWSVTVRFDANGGVLDGENSGGEVEVGTPIGQIFPTQEPTREDRNFQGWNTQRNGGGLHFTHGDTRNIFEGMTLYAQWDGEPDTEEMTTAPPTTEPPTTGSSTTAPLTTAPPTTGGSTTTPLTTAPPTTGGSTTTPLTTAPPTTGSSTTIPSTTAPPTTPRPTAEQEQQEREERQRPLPVPVFRENSIDQVTVPTVLPPREVPDTHILYVRGYPDGTFGPELFMTRLEMAQALFRLLDNERNLQKGTENFIDVNENHWYADAINYLTTAEILLGFEDGTFRPRELVTRAELTAVLSRLSAKANGAHAFTDVEGHWGHSYIVSAFNNNWISGYGDGTFRPNNPITRAEAVTIINRAFGRPPNPATIDHNLNGRTIFSDVHRVHWAFYEIKEAALEHDFLRNESNLEVWVSIRN